MKVILKEEIENLGRKGDVVEVAPGYGRNFLIPKKLALEITSSNIKMIEIEKQAMMKKVEQERMSFQDLIQKLNNVSLTFSRKSGEKDMIFGSVSSADIKEALDKQGLEIDKKKILLDEPIKRLGNYTVPIKVYHDDKAEIKIEVIKEEEEGEKKEEKKIKEKREEKEEEMKNEEKVEEEEKKEDEAEKGKKVEMTEEDKKEETPGESKEQAEAVSEQQEEKEEAAPETAEAKGTNDVEEPPDK